MELARKLLLGASSLAVIFFVFLLVILSAEPAQFEQRLKAFAVDTVKSETINYARDQGINLPDNLGGTALQQELANRMEERSQAFGTALELKVDEIVADALAKACSLDCEQRETVRDIAGRYLKRKAEQYDIGAASMRDFAIGRYQERVRGLHRDLIIVAVTNLIVFLLIVLLTVRKIRFMPILVKIGGIAFISASVLLIWYIFGQDWMTALIFNDFVGLAYSVFLGIIFLSLCDLALNEARILSAIADMFGSSLSVISC